MSSEKAQRYQSLEDPTSSSSGRKGISFGEESSRLQKVPVILLAVALLTIVGLAIYIGVKKENSSSTSKTNVCQSQACIGLAGEIIRKLNTSVDPCTDFYEYACGSWIADTIRPDYVGRLSSFSSLSTLNHERLRNELVSTPVSTDSAVGKASQFYATCMDTTSLHNATNKLLQDLVNDLGGWNAQDQDVTTVLIKAITKYAGFPLFSVFVARDQKNTSRYLYHINQGGTGMATLYYTSNSSDALKYRTAYKKLLTASLKLFEVATEVADDIYDIEFQLANVSADIVALRDPNATYNKMAISQLNATYAHINWLSLLRGLLPDSLSPSVTITESTEVIVQHLQFLEGISELLAERKKEAITNYMIWQTIRPLLLDLDSAFQGVYNTFRLETSNTQPTPRSQYCVARTDNCMGYATGRLFVDKYFSADTRNEADFLVKEIKTSFKRNLQLVKWMDKPTREKAAAKVDAVVDLVGYPNFLKNDTQLNARYKKLSVTTTCHVCNAYNARALIGEHQRSMLFDVPIHEFEMTADTVNAYYEPPENIIVFPAGILQPPFYEKDGPKALNYGGIGSVVGHELTHGFDDKGSQFDKNGNLEIWWTTKARESFKEHTACVSAQYSRYELFGVHVNGSQTLGENIADHGGIKMAYNAFQRWQQAHGDQTLPSGSLDFNSNQLFFIAFAQIWCEKSSKESVLSHLRTDVHSPHRYRVIGTLSDFAPFSTAFKCGRNTTMNPENKCPVW